MRDARAIANAQTEAVRALRTELAELAADAEAQLPPGTTYDAPIVAESRLPRCPTRSARASCCYVEKSFKRGLAAQMLDGDAVARPARRAPGGLRGRGVPRARRAPRGLRGLGSRRLTRAGSEPQAMPPSSGVDHVTTSRAPPSMRNVSPSLRSPTDSTGASLRSNRASAIE